MDDQQRSIEDDHWQDAKTLWGFHHMGHPLRPCSAAIALGCHDLDVATFAAELLGTGLFPVVVFSGATSGTTSGRFPRGEAVHYREHALEQGVPDTAILLEPLAANTGQNIELSRTVLKHHGVHVTTLMLISTPFMERRAYATCRKKWSDVDITCASRPITFDDYVKADGDGRLVIDMIMGDMQRIIEYPKLGFAIEQDVPEHVHAAFERLRRAGFDSKLLPPLPPR